VPADDPTARDLLDQLHALTLRDEAAAIDLYAEDAVHEIPFSPGGAPVKIEGRETLRQMMAAQGDSPVAYEEFADRRVYQTDDPDLVIWKYTVVGKIKASGAPFAFPNVLLLRARDGKIAATRAYFNPAHLAQLLG